MEKVNDNWMIGNVRGEEGMFPLAFVKVKVSLEAGVSIYL